MGRFMESIHGIETAQRDHEPKEAGFPARAFWSAVTECNEVTALASASARDGFGPPGANQSGDSADSVAAVQNFAGAPRFMERNHR